VEVSRSLGKRAVRLRAPDRALVRAMRDASRCSMLTLVIGGSDRGQEIGWLASSTTKINPRVCRHSCAVGPFDVVDGCDGGGGWHSASGWLC
jgi:hypothetical protein